MATMVQMTHPDGGGETSTVTEKAFHDYWSEKGWVLVAQESDLELAEVEYPSIPDGEEEDAVPTDPEQE
ncbi:MAG: hypothetical protein GTO63_16875 [Anaerolineae bacterium]|nr:hypothetical protein [Anaerolineae bacterium]NIN96472.1 hypothetical protein [Anaerolineae bacterium]